MAGYAVVTTTQVMKAEALPVNTSAQKADSHTWGYLEGKRTVVSSGRNSSTPPGHPAAQVSGDNAL